MLKKLFLLFLLFIISSQAFATVFVHSPLETKLGNDERINLGKVAPGQTIIIVIERKSEKAEKWDALSVDTSLLPSDWFFSSTVLDETIEAQLSVPENARISTQRITFRAFNSVQPELADTFFADLSVVKPEQVFDVGIDLSKIETTIFEPVPLKITINNNSIAAANFVVYSANLPSNWLQAGEQSFGTSVQAQSAETIELFITPKSYGKRTAVLNIDSPETGFSESIGFELNVLPTLKGKFQAGFFGLPFYSITLWPYYLINALLSLL